jgi:DNA adenine methylase
VNSHIQAQQAVETGSTRYLSPLRYPGGKAKLADLVKSIFQANELLDGAYAEPYAGGAGVALALLCEGYATNIYINDIDPAVYAIWSSILGKTEDFCRLVQDTPATPSEWHRQRRIYCNATTESTLALGFAAFFLNRTNRSGIIHSGSMIGGLDQAGEWKVDARYNRSGLISRIERIARCRKRIHLSNLDAVVFLTKTASALPKNSLVYLDPPYYTTGQQGLYANYYKDKDHSKVAETLSAARFRWVVSYDNVSPIRRLYANYRSLTYTLRYTAAERQHGVEVMFFSPNLTIPPRKSVVARRRG